MDRRIIVLFVTIFIDLLGFGIVIPILPNLAKELVEGKAIAETLDPDVAVGLVAAVFSVIQFLFAPIFGSISDRIGRRPIILGSILANALGYVLFGLAGSFLMLLLARVISGFGSANISASQAYIADISKPEERAKKMGIIGAAFGLGFVFGPPIGGWLFQIGGEKHGLEWVGFFTAVLCVLNFLWAYFALPESNLQKSGVKNKPVDTFKGMVKAWSIEVIGELLLINFIYISAFSMMQINASVLWKERYSLSPVQIGNIFGIIGVFSAIVQGTLIGYFQKRLGLRKMLIIGCPIAGLGLTLIPLPTLEWFYPIQIIAILLLAISNGLLMPSINSLVSLHSPAGSQGKMLGILQSMGSLARAVGPLLSGFLYAQYYALPYLSGGFLMIITLILVLMLSRKI